MADELTQAPTDLANLIFHVRALMAREDTVIPDVGGNPADDPLPATLQETPGDLSRQELVARIDGLAEEQQDALVALMWVGRGDGEPEEWQDLLQMAAERRDGSTAEYLLGHPLVAEYWAAGLESLGHGSAVISEGEY